MVEAVRAAGHLLLGWVPGVVILLIALVTTLRTLTRTARELAPSVRCPRGHLAATYGLVRCNVCGFVGEGSVWRCAACDAAYGHMPCPTCGLSIRNPAL
jgi:hypothetical protein